MHQKSETENPSLPVRKQANPLNVPRPSLDILNSPRILFAAAPLVVPMTLRLSNLSLRAIVVLVVSRQKGITLVFKNDPLEKVDVSSSFDGVESVAGFIQREIENQLREAFRSDLPSVIHRLSQKWLSGEVKSAGKAAGSFKAAHKVGGLVGEGFDKDAKIETRTAYDAGRASAEVHGLDEHGGGVGGGGPTTRGRAHTRRMSARDSDTGESVELAGSQVDSTWSTWGGNRMTRGGGASASGLASSRYSATSSDPYPGSRSPSLRRLASRSSAGHHHHHPQSTRRPSSSGPSSLVSHDQLDSVPESIESYDPTYGLRPDSIPHHAGFKNYEKLVKGGSSRRGLGDVLSDAAADGLGGVGLSPDHAFRDPYDDEYDEAAGLGEEDDDLEPDSHYYSSSSSSHFETIPAVGGGTITRPRVFHTQSQMRFGPGVASSAYDPASAGSLTAHGSPSSVTARSAAGGSTASTLGLGRSASFYGGHVRSASAGGAFATPFGNGSGGLAARFSSGASSSGASSARFPFPRHPPSYSNQGGPSRAGSSIVRNTSMPALSRHATSSSSYAAPRVDPPLATPTLQHRTDRGGGGGGGLEPEPESDQLAFTRPSPVDLLSRSPSSLLNTSFLDEEHLPITLNPSGNDSCAHLATLTSSNQTLSPFTRDHAHVTARSSPHLGGAGAGGSAGEEAVGGALRVASVPRGRSELLFGKAAPANANGQQQPVKAVRKRLHRIGSAKLGSGSSMPSGGALSGYASPGSPAMPNSPVMVSASTFNGGAVPQTGYHYNHRSSSIPSSSAYPQSQTDTRRQGGQHYRRSASAYSSLSPSRYAAASPRTAPSPFSVTRGKVSLASDYGTAMATGARAGVGAHKTAPSELSDYFPPAVTATMADMEAMAGSSAREMLSRMGLH